MNDASNSWGGGKGEREKKAGSPLNCRTNSGCLCSKENKVSACRTRLSRRLLYIVP